MLDASIVISFYDQYDQCTNQSDVPNVRFALPGGRPSSGLSCSSCRESWDGWKSAVFPGTCTIQRALSMHLQTDVSGQRSHCVADQQLFPGSLAHSCLWATFMLVPGPYHAWCVMETDPPLHVVSDA